MRRTLTLALLLGLPAVALPALAAARACADAESDFLRAWEDAEGSLTRPVARAARSLVDACPAPHAEAEAGVEARTMAALCGFGARAASPPGTEADITGSIMVGPKVVTERDRGPAAATYEAVTDLVEYEATGANWTIRVASSGSGVLTVHGVPFPLSTAKGDAVQAEAGCGVPPGPTLCWGTGFGYAWLSSVGAISAGSRFHDCR